MLQPVLLSLPVTSLRQHSRFSVIRYFFHLIVIACHITCTIAVTWATEITGTASVLFFVLVLFFCILHCHISILTHSDAGEKREIYSYIHIHVIISNESIQVWLKKINSKRVVCKIALIHCLPYRKLVATISLLLIYSRTISLLLVVCS